MLEILLKRETDTSEIVLKCFLFFHFYLFNHLVRRNEMNFFVRGTFLLLNYFLRLLPFRLRRSIIVQDHQLQRILSRVTQGILLLPPILPRFQTASSVHIPEDSLHLRNQLHHELPHAVDHNKPNQTDLRPSDRIPHSDIRHILSEQGHQQSIEHKQYAVNHSTRLLHPVDVWPDLANIDGIEQLHKPIA